MSQCRVLGCRFSATHVTRGHLCGRCKRYNHGMLECGDIDAVDSLRRHARDVVSQPCDVVDCSYRWLHTTCAHWCRRCARFGGGQICCQINAESEEDAENAKVRCPTCRTLNTVDVSVVVHAGAECCVCFQSGPTVVFPQCRHANVCSSCVFGL